MIRFVIFDVDDVLLNMDAASKRAEESVRDVVRGHVNDDALAASIYDRFKRGYDTLRIDLRRDRGEPSADYGALIDAVNRWQRGVTEAGHETKRWSRDSLLAIALEAHGVPCTDALITNAMDRYWTVLAQHSLLMEDVVAIVDVLRARGIRFHLATNSDGFLTFDEARQTFVYDPPDAVAKKKRRLGLLQTIGIRDEHITVGDPIGKPDPRFFETVFDEFAAQAGCAIAADQTLVVGDSLSNDVLPPMALGAAKGAWLVRAETEAGPRPLPGHDAVWTIRTLLELEPLL